MRSCSCSRPRPRPCPRLRVGGLLPLILVGSFALRLLLFPLDGYYIDINDFKIWFRVAAEHPFSFYERTWSDYPPFNVYIFWLFGSVAAALDLWSSPYLIYLVKLPANLFDIATAALIFAALRRHDERLAVFAAAAYAFNPAVMFDAAVWGQMDAIYTFFIVLSFLMLLRRQLELSAVSFAIAVLTKPQSVVALPPLLIYVANYLLSKTDARRRRMESLRLLLSALVFVAASFLLVVPFVPPHEGGLADRIVNSLAFLNEVYTEGYECYPYTSINAYNVWALLLMGFWKPDVQEFLGLSYRTYGVLMFCVLAAVVLFSLWRQLPKDSGGNLVEVEILAFSTFLMFFSFFMTMTRMHERYMFPAFAFLALALRRRFSLVIYAGLTATFFFNLCYVLSVLNAKSFIPDGDLSLLIIPPLNALLLLFSFLTFVQRPKP